MSLAKHLFLFKYGNNEQHNSATHELLKVKGRDLSDLYYGVVGSHVNGHHDPVIHNRLGKLREVLVQRISDGHSMIEGK